MRRILGLSLLVALIGVFCTPALAGDAVKVGVLAKRGAPACLQQWNATGAYLSEKLQTPVKIIPLTFDAIDPAVSSGQVDFILANSSIYVHLQEAYGVQAACTLVNKVAGKGLKEFGGVLFVKADSPIQTLSDIKGTKFMWVDETSFGGAQMAWRVLLENGVDPKRDCAEVLKGGKHDNVVLAVKNGQADVGTVRSDTLERMQDEGKISMADFRILNKVNDDFPFVHSTPLYPEWPLAACKATSPELAQKVAAALMAMTKDDPAAVAGKIVGWTAPLDYRSVADCLRAVGMTNVQES